MELGGRPPMTCVMLLLLSFCYYFRRSEVRSSVGIESSGPDTQFMVLHCPTDTNIFTLPVDIPQFTVSQFKGVLLLQRVPKNPTEPLVNEQNG